MPGQYALLSIGACLVQDTSCTFYIELCPDSTVSIPEAMAISGLSLDQLKESGIPPVEAMQAFNDWVEKVTPSGVRPVFVALNAPFDWMFVNEYFHRYLGRNPFGHSALDIKAFFMGKTGVSWSETSMKHISAHFLNEKHLTHNALRDAQDQAEIFLQIMSRPQKIQDR
jgi:ribonuclease T